MNTDTFILHNLSDTEKLGQLLGKNALPGDVICLDGDLGAGKTALSQAIARSLHVPEKYYVSSPSFAIMHEYDGRLKMYHMDFYRLGDSSEVIEGGFEDYFYGDGLCVIEWSLRADDVLPEEKLTLFIEVTGDLSRKVTMHSTLKNKMVVNDIIQEFT